VVGPTDPQWTEEDRALWRVWRERKATQCPDCRTWPEEWEADRTAYIGDDHICAGCEVLAREAENDPNPKGTPGRKIGLIPFQDDPDEVAYDQAVGIDTLRSVLKRRETEPLPEQ